jgi:hypothetical protein
MDEQITPLHTTAYLNSASTFNLKFQPEQPEILSTLLKVGNQSAKVLNSALIR